MDQVDIWKWPCYPQHHTLELPLLKQSSGQTPSNSLEEQLGKAKSSRSLLPFPKIYYVKGG
jgi:hypothetical protein